MVCYGAGAGLVCGEDEHVPDQPPATRSRYNTASGTAFKKDLDAIGIFDKQRLIAQLQAFMRDWQADITDEDLGKTWGCKPINGKNAKKLLIKEIRPLGNYRILFTEIAEHELLYLLSAFRKTSTYREHTTRAVERAANYWKTLS